MNIVILTGAGISAESGIRTFRSVTKRIRAAKMGHRRWTVAEEPRASSARPHLNSVSKP